MHNVHRFLVATLVPALIVGIFAVSAVAAGGNAGKVTLCHFASHKFVKITVSMNSEPAHMRHGDVLPDEYGDCSGDGSQGSNEQGDNEQGDSEGSQGSEADKAIEHGGGEATMQHTSSHQSGEGGSGD